MSGDNLFSALKSSWSFSNSNLGHLWHSLDSDCLPVLETLWSSSYSESLPAIPNTTMCSFHPSTSPDISSKACSKTSTSFEGNSEISSDSAPSNLNSAPTFSEYSWGCNGDRVAPVASDIKGHVDEHGCWSQHVSNSNSTSIKHLLLLPYHSQPYHTQSIIYYPSFIINGNSWCWAYSIPIVLIFPIFSRLPSPLCPPFNSVKWSSPQSNSCHRRYSPIWNISSTIHIFGNEANSPSWW